MTNKGKKVRAWTRQRELRKLYKDEEVPDIPEIVSLLDNIHCGKLHPQFQSHRARALFAMYYLTGCRISEIVRCVALRKQALRKRKVISKLGKPGIIYDLDGQGHLMIDHWIEEHDFEGIKKKDISYKVIDGRKCMLIRTENRKNKHRKTKRQPIPIQFEKPIAEYIYKYCKVLKPDNVLFNFQSKRATQIINDTTGFNVHFIRHIRATHLITKYDFNEQMLIKFMGWTDGRPARSYMELKSTDIFRQFFKNGG